MATAPATIYGNSSGHKSHGVVLYHCLMGKKEMDGERQGEGKEHRDEGRFLFTYMQNSL